MFFFSHCGLFTVAVLVFAVIPTKKDPKICGVNVHHCHFYDGRGYLSPSFFALAGFHCSALSRVVDSCDVATEIKPSVTNQPTVPSNSLQSGFTLSSLTRRSQRVVIT